MFAMVSLFTFSPLSVSLKLSDMSTVLESLSPVIRRRPLEPWHQFFFKFFIVRLSSFVTWLYIIKVNSFIDEVFTLSNVQDYFCLWIWLECFSVKQQKTNHIEFHWSIRKPGKAYCLIHAIPCYTKFLGDINENFVMRISRTKTWSWCFINVFILYIFLPLREMKHSKYISPIVMLLLD